MTKHYCDKCGKELPIGERENVKIGLWQHHILDRENDEKGGEYDSYKVFRYELCNECAGQMTEIISGHNEADTVVLD